MAEAEVFVPNIESLVKLVNGWYYSDWDQLAAASELVDVVAELEALQFFPLELSDAQENSAVQLSEQYTIRMDLARAVIISEALGIHCISDDASLQANFDHVQPVKPFDDLAGLELIIGLGDLLQLSWDEELQALEESQVHLTAADEMIFLHLQERLFASDGKGIQSL